MNKLASFVYRNLQSNPKLLSAAKSAYLSANDKYRRLLERSVPVDRMLTGGENGIPGGKYARLTGNLVRCSVPVAESGHSKFLAQYKEIGERILEPDILCETEYYKNALEALDLCGYYFGAKSQAEIGTVARKFIENFKGELGNDSTPGRSRPGSPVVLRKIADSNGMYEIADGHHRVAIAVAQGHSNVSAYVLNEPAVRTPMQDLLLDCLWTRGEKILYQPIDLPETRSWHLVRNCSDRLDHMTKWLKEHGYPSSEKRTYVDIGCSYGWFVAQLRDRGFDAHGVERDTAGIRIGQEVYGLTEDQIVVSEIVNFCESFTMKYDFVSCFSVLHHFVLGKSRITAEQFMKYLSELTGTALFFETGQNHERWFSELLSEWDDAFIIAWIKSNSTFTNVQKIGVDEDDRGREKGNYSRSLFVCTRE